jgi:hypothetical protein
MLNLQKGATMLTSETIDRATLVNLIQAGAVHEASIIGQPGGWEVVVSYGKVSRALAVKEGQVRIFRKLDTLDSFLRGIGLPQYQVDGRQFDAQAFKATRTNAAASERLKRAHDAAAYDKWFSAEIDEAIKEADDPATIWVSNEDAKAVWAKRRAELVKLAGGVA